MESRRNGPQLSSRHDDDDDGSCLVLPMVNALCSINEVTLRILVVGQATVGRRVKKSKSKVRLYYSAL